MFTIHTTWRGHMLKRIILVFLASALLLTAVSCKKPPEETTPVLNEEESKVPAEHVESEEPEEIEKLAEGAESDFVKPAEGIRPYAVMIDNEGTKSLPQGGLHMAQVIYEVIAEGGETRLMPVFWNVDPEMIGPVRSSRHYFLDYAMEHDAIYIHFGWSPMAERDIPKFGINNANGVGYGGEIFWDLTDDPNNWQDSYTSMEKIKGFVAKAKYRTETDKKHVFSYNESDEEIGDGQQAEKISITYAGGSYMSYEYDKDTKTYKRNRKDKPHMERITGEQLETKNIIVQRVKNYRIPGDEYDRQEVETVGSGSGWYITNGKAAEIKWVKESRPAPTEYFYKNGDRVVLNPGQTWVQIVPLGGIVDIE
jgi:hypothetical protein